ncbi:(Fe-S)-binding protein [Metallumcola ferriviriculae]|uniref:Glycolate oxidase iron-sulfur subunit n=1 Tax=Metallumcola ferriviriculae TaxID=3039180 RepID=A0AAU0ULC5_9FIRM|nr:(Fe-S)-binding protein [Desulfitibacteraceae bacterium MK1]
MAYYDSLDNVRAEITRCMKCGNCQAVCPIYKEVLGESGVARGKIQIAKDLLEGELELTDKMQDIFSLCLTCKACAANCPCGVQPDKIILAARAELVRKKGLPGLKRQIFGVLGKPQRFKLGMGMAAKLQGFGLKKIPSSNAAHPRFPIGIDTRRIVRPLAKQSLLSRLPEVSKVSKPKQRAAFFTGCMLNYMYTEAGKAVVEVLNANDVEVITPKSQHCCGIPVFVHGDVKTAKAIAKYNLDIFAAGNYDAVITHCGTCIGAWVQHYPELLLDDAKYSKLAEQMAAKAYDVSQYLIDKVGLKEPTGQVAANATYHDPCHMVRGAGIAAQPRQVIESIPGVTLTEMQKPDRCCGGAGSFSLTHYPLSSQIRDKKIADALSVKPDMVLTSCGACRMQLEDGLFQAGSDVPVKHVVELLAEAYVKGGGRDSGQKTG